MTLSQRSSVLFWTDLWARFEAAQPSLKDFCVLWHPTFTWSRYHRPPPPLWPTSSGSPLSTGVPSISPALRWPEIQPLNHHYVCLCASLLQGLLLCPAAGWSVESMLFLLGWEHSWFLLAESELPLAPKVAFPTSPPFSVHCLNWPFCIMNTPGACRTSVLAGPSPSKDSPYWEPSCHLALSVNL